MNTVVYFTVIMTLAGLNLPGAAGTQLPYHKLLNW